MVVMVLTACPTGVRGDLTRWLLEIAPGVFVGRLSARVRTRLWLRVCSLMKSGRAIMVYSARNEQHLEFEVFQPDWKPVDCDGVRLIKRPAGTDDATLMGSLPSGWSSASKYRRARKYRG
ncbi:MULTISPECIES: type I-E CRISPR-associated endoribonuclease Cas2e [Enorma]|uniref:Type I-E CRISPR-associated endoribonuclease Cas2 n=1 Tax=[Collinsella] massiliensis TaxID=1232426 RepID=A0A1Y3XV30_9ACTN|nr:type I-E CRISPR-associated endoribonuclease Cas2e [[Collinsella] massiliensis]OUN89446.1 type I-E CRISPR-associated endoribonuclease Cas2 [[Collinsella] massiliensis]